MSEWTEWINKLLMFYNVEMSSMLSFPVYHIKSSNHKFSRTNKVSEESILQVIYFELCRPKCIKKKKYWIHIAAVVQSLSHVQFFATPRAVAHQAPLSMWFPRQEHYSGLPFPPPGDLSDPEMESASVSMSGRFFTTEPLGKPAEYI